MKFYAVQIGRTPGVYSTWELCEAQVIGFPGAHFKSFKTLEEAEMFVYGLDNQKTRPRKNMLSSSSPLHRIHIWVDGSCLHNGKGTMHFGWAYLILDGTTEIHRASGRTFLGDTQKLSNFDQKSRIFGF